ncbi:MAG TPA: response regulator [Thermoanaerobaculia bacterium]|nr:response regulator [Thermoanaerobaculia bacterium]
MSTILIVDDNPMFLSEASKLCQREGFETMTARSWSELNSVLATRVPDLVLMDIEMPSIPGHRLGTFVRARYRIPIVLVSGHSEERLKRLFDSSDADGWICKPLTRDKLIAAVTRFMPIIQEHEAELTKPPAQERAATTKPTVLLIEDEALIASRIESTLAETSTVTLAEDGESAIEKLWSGSYDCILLDLMLPRLSGFDVVRHLMMRRPELLKATVIMTAAGDASLQFIDPTAVGKVLRKPFDLGTLPDVVAEVAAHR